MTPETAEKGVALPNGGQAAAGDSRGWSLRLVLGTMAFAVLTVLLPLAFSWTVAATFYTPKLLPLYLGASLAVLAGYGLGDVSVAARDRERGWLSWRGRALIVAGALLLWGLVCVVTAASRWTGLLGTYDQGTGWLWMAASLVAWASLGRLDFGERRLRWLLDLFLVGGIVAAALGLLSVAHWEPLRFRLGFRSDGRASSTFGNPLFFGSYLSLVILVALDRLVGRGRSRGRRERRFVPGTAVGRGGVVLPAVAVLIGIGALVATLARGAWLGALAGVVVWAVVGLRTGRVMRRTLAFGAAVLVVVVAVASLAVPRLSAARLDPGARVGAAPARGVDVDTIETRWLMWGIALRAIADRPLTGWGPNNYRFGAQEHMTAQKLAAEPVTRDADAHNLPLEIAATWGVPGMLLFLAWFALVLVGAARARGGTTPLALGLCASYFIASATMPQNLAVTTVVFALLAVLVPVVGAVPNGESGAGPCDSDDTEAGRRSLRMRLRAWLGPLALAMGTVGVIVSLVWGVRLLQADGHYLRGVLGRSSSSAVGELSAATHAMPVIEAYWTALGIAQLRVGAAQEDGALEQEGFGSLNRALRIAPRDVDALDALARAYLNERNWGAARVTAEQAVSYAPVEPAGHADLSYALLKTGDRPGALREAELAVAVDTANPRVYYVVGLTYRDAGDVARARQMLQKALALSPGFVQARQALEGLPAS